MVDTNPRSDNEQWLFDTLVEMEGLGLLGDFCRCIGVDPPGGAAPLVRAKPQKNRRTRQDGSGNGRLTVRPPEHPLAATSGHGASRRNSPRYYPN